MYSLHAEASALRNCQSQASTYPCLMGVNSRLTQLRLSGARTSENFRVPVRLFQAAFSFVFEKFVERVEKDSRPAGVDANVEIDFVVEEMGVALSHHPE